MSTPAIGHARDKIFKILEYGLNCTYAASFPRGNSPHTISATPGDADEHAHQ
jgi:hypothetical protein